MQREARPCAVGGAGESLLICDDEGDDDGEEIDVDEDGHEGDDGDGEDGDGEEVGVRLPMLVAVSAESSEATPGGTNTSGGADATRAAGLIGHTPRVGDDGDVWDDVDDEEGATTATSMRLRFIL
jgi:hypothetical protein